MNNFRMYNPDMSVRRLPTDGEDLTDFISRIAGRPDDMEYVSGKGKGLLVIQFDWPESTKIIDNRDQMHKRGWTYFRISGQLNGQQVSGTGQIPFVYATSKRYSPWFKLQIGSSVTINDSGTTACVFDANGKALARYTGGSFFKGLGRPWMGLHTIDTVRRDAAEQEVWFEAKKISGSNKSEVVLTGGQVKLVYTIDMETDVIEKITFSTDSGDEGELRFSYLQNIDNPGSEFTRPRTGNYRSPQQSSPGMLWLVKLINNSW